MKRRLGFFFCLGILCAAYADDLASADYLTAFEQEVVREHNLARTKPQEYIGFLEDYARGFSGNLHIAKDGTRTRTHEGTKAIDEAITFMRQQRPVGVLRPSLGMSAGAAMHAAEQAKTGETGHAGRDGRTHGSRVNRYGEWQAKTGENIHYGDGSARDLVMRLIVDDGVPSRGHRTNIFLDSFRVIGVGCDAHPKYRQSCVLTYAAAFEERLSAGKAARAANGQAEAGSRSKPATRAGLRTWTDRRGRQVQGTVHSLDGDTVRLKTERGKIISLPRKMLSVADQVYLKTAK